MRNSDKRGIAVVIAMVLLVVFVIVSVLIFGQWFSFYTSDVAVKLDQNAEDQTESSRIESVIDDDLFFYNDRTDYMTVTSVKFDNEECYTGNQQVAPGVSSFAIKDCAVTINDESVNVLVITTNKIYENTIYVGGFCENNTAQGFFNGTGVVSDPWKICNCEQLENAGNYLGGNFTLTRDISCGISPFNTGSGFEPIGNFSDGFTGSFEGNFNTVEGLFVNRSGENYIGLFGHLDGGATVQNLEVENAEVIGTSGVGLLVGAATSGNVENVSVSGVIGTGAGISGGIVGILLQGSINRVSAYVDSEAGVQAGIIVGRLSASTTLNNSFSSGSILGQVGGRSGGLVGWNLGGTVENSLSVAAVETSGSQMGGLIGQSSGTVTSSYWDNVTSGQTTSSGGTARTTSELYDMAGFTGWDFNNTWQINNGTGYPKLRMENLFND